MIQAQFATEPNRPANEVWCDLTVALTHDSALRRYPELDRIPFDPHTDYPEYDGPTAKEANPVYAAVRRTLQLLGRDDQNFDTTNWNPLRGIVEPGMKVVLKPNLVSDSVRPGADLDALFTHMSVIRPVIDYVRLSLRGQGSILLGDAPIQGTNWDNLLHVSGIGKTIGLLNDRPGVAIAIEDFRGEITIRDRFDMVIERTLRNEENTVEVDLGGGSTLAPIIERPGRFRVSQYDPAALALHHNAQRNCYMIYRPVLEADVVVNLPKLKVHKKAGITCSLKNLVGINCRKDYLAHYRIGDARTGTGDQYAEFSRLCALYSALCDAMETGGTLKRRMASLACKCVSRMLKISTGHTSYEGDWYGNDTTWRMAHDLNLILCYATAAGVMTDKVQRRIVNIVDGVIAGERDSPLQPTARPCGTIIAGTNPLAVDLVAATAIGYDLDKVPLLRDAWRAPSRWQLPPHDGSRLDVTVLLDDEDELRHVGLSELAELMNLGLEPPMGWVGKIERNGTARTLDSA